MEQEPQLEISKDLQRAFLAVDFTSSSKDSYLNIEGDEINELDEQVFERWIPSLRQAIDEGNLNLVVDDLYGSIEEQFENLETQILQDSQINNNLSASIRELESIQSMIHGPLQKELKYLNDEVRESTQDLVGKKQLLINNTKTLSKISESTILIQKILQILELSNRCHELIEDNDFFKALQAIETFEAIYLQDFKQYNFQFLTKFYSSIPFLKTKIRNESINLIKKSLTYSLEKTFSLLGHKYYDVYESEILADWIKTKHGMKLQNYKFNSSVELSLRDTSKLEVLDLNNFCNLDEFHDSVLIFDSLNEMDFFLSEFSKEYEFRKSKLIDPLFLTGSSTASYSVKKLDTFSQNLTFDEFQEYILKILGFLIYDRELHKSTDFILSNNCYRITDDFWESFMKRLNPILTQMVRTKLNVEESLTQFKDFLGVIIAILENLSFDVELLYSTQVLTYEKYCEILVQAFEKEFTSLLQDDDFMPLAVSDKSLYEKILKICWLSEQASDYSTSQEETFSATLPFSPLFPMTCTLLKKTYTNAHNFVSVFFKNDLSHLNLILVKAIDKALGKVVNNNIKSKLDTTSREEIAQILVNLDYFVIAAKEFSSILTRENLTNNPDIEIRLSAIKQLTETRKSAESKLINLIDSKVSDLMEFIEFDWNTTDIRKEPDMTIVDISQFLEMMFTSTLANIPSSIKMLLIFREFDIMTRRFLEKLLHEAPDRISPQSVFNFETDILYLEEVISKIFPNEVAITSSSPSIPGTPTQQSTTNGNRSSLQLENNVKSLLSTFSDLKQHIELMKVNDMEEYKDNDIRLRKYSRVKPEAAQILLSKLQPLTADQSTLTSDEGSTTDSKGNNRFAKLFSRG